MSTITNPSAGTITDRIFTVAAVSNPEEITARRRRMSQPDDRLPLAGDRDQETPL
ncbi:MAG: hypothetical protein ACRDVP_02690 [Acidimicrobiales bacterium]